MGTLRPLEISRIDTAAGYAEGESEKIVGRSGLARDFIIDTKILWNPPGDGVHTDEAVERSLENSPDVLGLKKGECPLLSRPDHQTPAEQQARAFDAQYRKSRFGHLGVLNFSPKYLGEWLNVSGKESLVKPTVYEGQYNLVCRVVEADLFPLHRHHKIAFNA